MRNLHGQRTPARQRPATWVVATLLAFTLSGSVWCSEAGGSEIPRGLGLLDQVYATGEQPQIVIRESPLTIDDPRIPGERLVLTTVGAEHAQAGGTEFHPLVSVLMDETFSAAGEGEWLATWNLGDKSPGFLSRLRAMIPGFTARKRVRKKELFDLRQRLENFEELAAGGKIKAPKPYFKVTEENRRSTIGLVLNSIKRGLSFTSVSFPAQLLFRSYLLRRKDLEERRFEQAYLGLNWYADLSSTDPWEEASLPLNSIHEIKFRLLADRSAFGRFVDPSAKEDFVHGYEAEIRDHLWGTSCYLASAANEYHLAYEELRRFGAGEVPLALGGILYYDPRLAPEPDQVKWGIGNPFDLPYNPFDNPKVQRAAGGGERVPLAIYVYQSNLALKPIVAVDFFSPNNPRVRESATYWRRMGNEAISAYGGIGLLYTLLNRALSFTANKKEITWLTDKKSAFGIEELRLSLLSHLYFEPDAADQMSDRVDRLIVNPLVQPSRLQGLRAQLQYRALLSDEGRDLVGLGRDLRENLIRKRLRKEQGPLTEADYRAYRLLLTRERRLETLKLCMADKYLPSVPLAEIVDSIKALGDDSTGQDTQTIQTLIRFRLEMQERPAEWRGGGGPMDLVEQAESALSKMYRASGRDPGDLKKDLAAAAETRARKREEERLKLQEQHAKRFEQMLEKELDLLEGFVESGGNLTTYSPWYVAEAIHFFREVPVVIEVNPKAAKRFQPHEEKVQALLSRVERRLASAGDGDKTQWLEQQRFDCLRSVQSARAELRAALAGPNPAGGSRPAPARVAGSGKFQ